MKNILFKNLFLLITLLLINACSSYQKLLKGNDYELKYKYAEKYFLEKKYNKSLQLLEELQLINRGTERGEKVLYYYAKSHFETGDFVAGRYFFAKFVNDFPNSLYAEECAYLKAYCYYLDSPKYSLEQSNTILAIEAMQNFINDFPNSNKVIDGNVIIDKLRAKMAQKDFEAAKHYYDIENYKSSIVAFANILKSDPTTTYKQEIMFLIIKSNYLLALQSVDAKKGERYSAAIDNYFKFVDNFPQSVHTKEVEDIYKKSLKQKQKSL